LLQVHDLVLGRRRGWWWRLSWLLQVHDLVLGRRRGWWWGCRQGRVLELLLGKMLVRDLVLDQCRDWWRRHRRRQGRVLRLLLSQLHILLLWLLLRRQLVLQRRHR
jgi:hypothetical protein